MTAESPKPWNHLRPWHTNAALILIGWGMIAFSRQLILEYDHYTVGTSGVSSGQVFLYLGAMLILWLHPENVDRFTFPIILAVAIACRLAVLFPEPFLSTDVYRYAWDGVVQHAHISPYRYVASDPALAFLRAPNDDLYANMNRRDYAHTIYPPAAQVLFYLVTWISPLVVGMKTAMVLFEGLTMYGLVLLCRQMGMRRERTLIYAWCPLLIWEFGSSGHLDAVAMAYITFAMLFRYKGKPVLTGVFLGLAFLTKLYPIVLFPALYQRRPDGRLDWKMPAVILAMTVAFYSLYLSVGKLVFGFLGTYAQEEGMETGVRYYGLELAHHVPGLQTLPNGVFVVFAGVVMAGLAYWCWRVSVPQNSAPQAFLLPLFALAFVLMLLFSPHYPWYIAWLVPFLVLMPNLPVLTYLCVFFYMRNTALAVGSGAPEFKLNSIVYAATLVALLVEIGLRRLPATKDWFFSLNPLRSA